ncbi:MAG: aminotransferase class IV, partial [Acidimicrobiia bacterium]|nr:aminotransferase class IV [Acidimicrobiia bacterium]
MYVSVDGVRADNHAVSVFDWAFLRGDGCFEAIRSYQGRPFQVEAHVDRLARSASALRLELPDLHAVTSWIQGAAEASGDAVIRVVATRGGAPWADAPPRVVVLGEPVPDVPESLVLAGVPAPWHPAGRQWDLAGAKTLSYAPNLSAARLAREGGAHDALLLADDGTILEGPTFSIAWVADGVIETPGLDLFILDSITRRVVLGLARELDVEVRQGSFNIARLGSSDEVFAMSTIKEVAPVGQVDDAVFEAGPVTRRLRKAFRSLAA